MLWPILNKKIIERVIQKVVSWEADLMAWRVGLFESSSPDGLHGEEKCLHNAESNRQALPARSCKQNTITTTPLALTLQFFLIILD